jgi:hypothetical protein
VKTLLEEQVGIYLSEKRHLLSVKINPVRVDCVSCLESCYRSEFKTNLDFSAAAKAFNDKHGYLERKIAENIDEIVGVYLTAKGLFYTLETPFVFEPPVIDVSYPFDVSGEWIGDSFHPTGCTCPTHVKN